MSLRFRDQISPELARQARVVRDRKPILEAMGLEFTSLTKRAFTDPSLRPMPWADKKDGTAATLRKSGSLWHSIRIAGLTGSSVTIATDRIYAAIHQLGGVIKRGAGRITMPMRPFMPVLDGKVTMKAMEKIVAVGKAKLASLLK